jgi:hypothetical protein
MVRMRSRPLRTQSTHSQMGFLTTDAEIERIIGPLKSTDLMGATVKGIGSYLRLVYKAEHFSPIPEHLHDLVRRAA